MEAHLFKENSGKLLENYKKSAMRRVSLKQLEDGAWFADLPGFPGVWADGEPPESALATLEEVLADWLALKIADKDRDIPIIDRINLNVSDIFDGPSQGNTPK